MEDFDMTTTPEDLALDFLKEVREEPSKLDDDAFIARWIADAITTARYEDSRADKIKADHMIREMRVMAYYISHYCHNNPMPEIDLVTPLEISLERMLSSDRSMLSFVREHMVRLDAGEVKA